MLFIFNFTTVQVKLKKKVGIKLNFKSFNIIIHHKWLPEHLTKQLSFDSKCYFLGSAHRNKNVISRF